MTDACRSRSPRRLPPDDPRRRRLPMLLRSAWYGMNQSFRRRLTPLGLTPDQFTILRWLTEAPPAGLTQKGLSDLMCSDPNTIAALVARMTHEGLVVRTRGQRDARANFVRATPAGRQRFLQARPQALALQSELLAAIPPRQRERFLLHLQAVGAAAKNHPDA